MDKNIDPYWGMGKAAKEEFDKALKESAVKIVEESKLNQALTYIAEVSKMDEAEKRTYKFDNVTIIVLNE